MRARSPVAGLLLGSALLCAFPVGVATFGAVAAAQDTCGSPTSPTGLAGSAAGALPLVEVARVAYDAGFRGEDLVTAVALVPPESGGDPGARNSVGASGLWQVVESAHPGLFARWDWRVPADNAAMAFAVFSARGGFSDWVAFTSGAYEAHVPEARAAVAAAGLPADAMAQSGLVASAAPSEQLAGALSGACVPGVVGAVGPVSGPYLGGPTGCSIADPTGTGGCVAGSTQHALGAVFTAFGEWPVSCWDAHAWNPRSDHPLGLGCDFTVGSLGRRPGPEQRARGWELAEWLVAHRGPLAVSYVIWDGQFNDGSGWRRYSGGGVYDAGDVTGGHFDHVHLSVHDRSGTAA